MKTGPQLAEHQRQMFGCLTFIILQDVGRETPLVSDVGGIFTVLGLDHVL